MRMRRRSLLMGLPMVPLAGTARALTMRPAVMDETSDLATRCQLDEGHAATLDLAIDRLRQAGITFDEASMRATGRCPICGCAAVVSWR